jgi:hypothetical protein
MIRFGASLRHARFKGPSRHYIGDQQVVQNYGLNQHHHANLYLRC